MRRVVRMKVCERCLREWQCYADANLHYSSVRHRIGQEKPKKRHIGAVCTSYEALSKSIKLG